MKEQIKSPINRGLSRYRLQKKYAVLAASLVINTLGLALPLATLQIYDRVIPNHADESLWLLLSGLAVIVLFEVGLRMIRSVMLSWESARFDHRESTEIMEKILNAETIAFEQYAPGDYLDKYSSLDKVREFHMGRSAMLAVDLPFVGLFLILIFYIGGLLALIPVVLIGIYVILSMRVVRNLHSALASQSTLDGQRQKFMIEILSGIHTVKSMAMESLMLRRYERLQRRSAGSCYELSRIRGIVDGLGTSFVQIGTIVFVALGSLSVINGTLSLGGLAACSMLAARVLQPALTAMNRWAGYQSVKLAEDKVQDLLSLSQESFGSIKSDKPLTGHIQLQSIEFSYPNKVEKLFDELNLEIKPGESVAITGSNGEGKSTLIRLLSGCIKPNAGSVRIDGQEIYAYDRNYLRSQISVVPQHGVLFEGTLLENMTLYREGAVVDQAIDLAHVFGLDETLSTLPNGLDTQVGGAAVDTLSDGDRQKIVLIRALLGNAPILLLDDANSNFDFKNDQHLMKLLRVAKGKKTLVLVSHRPSFIRLCDHFYELSDGSLTKLEHPNAEDIRRAG